MAVALVANFLLLAIAQAAGPSKPVMRSELGGGLHMYGDNQLHPSQAVNVAHAVSKPVMQSEDVSPKSRPVAQNHSYAAVLEVQKASCDETVSGKLEAGYRGCQSTTTSGKTCQKWSAQKPHAHSQKLDGGGLGKHNYCRNPDGEPEGIWCYTTDAAKRWEYCDPKLTEAEEEKWEEKRKPLDGDADGCISAIEARAGKLDEKLFKKMDLDKDGKVCKDDYAKAIDPKRTKTDGEKGAWEGFLKDNESAAERGSTATRVVFCLIVACLSLAL